MTGRGAWPDGTGVRERARPPKLAVPHAPRGLVRRDRCVAALDAAVAAHRIVLVSAPAGYGKTTLVADWAGTQTRDVRWVSLDGVDDDPSRLGRLLAEALGAEPPGASPGGGAVGDEVDAVVRRSVGLGDGAVLVLDDVHRLSLTTARSVLGPLLRYPGARLVLAGRHDTSVPVQRLRADGELGELRETALAFTRAEVADLARTLGHAPTPEAVSALWEVTGGWPVAVRLAITAGVLDPAQPSMQRLRDRDVPLTGYLVEEIVGQLPDELAGFVLRGCFADTLDPRLADELVPDGARLLDECVDRGLFLTRLGATDSGEPTYRWHGLVAAHARALLTRRDPRAARETHRVVARLTAGNEPAAAIEHALHAGAPDVAARILGGSWPDLVVRGEAGTVRRLRPVLPPALRDDDPDVHLALAAADALVPGGDSPRPQGPAAELVRAFLAPGRPATEEALACGERVLGAVALDDATRALGSYLVGRAGLQRLRPGDGPHDHLARGAEIAQRRGWPALRLGCRAETSLEVAGRGEHRRAGQIAQEVLAEAEERGWCGTGLVAAAHLALGLSAYWRDELGTAQAELDAAVRAGLPDRRDLAVHAAALLAVVGLAQGDVAGLRRARDVTDAAWPGGAEPAHLAALRTLLTALELEAEGRPGDALALVDESEPVFVTPLALAWQADLRRRTGDVPGAWRALRAAGWTPAAGWTGAARATRAAPGPAGEPLDQVVVATRAAEALLHTEQDAAHRALEAALDAAQAEGVVRPLRDRAGELAPLLTAHLAWGSAHEPLVTRLLLGARSAPRTRVSTWELTARERDVLTCLRSTLTSEEIAASLYVSVNTLKSHLRAIYRKLGVDGRRAAVRAAVQRGLL